MNNRILLDALDDILARALNHPMFDMELFDAQDLEALYHVGGDTCDWTMIAIIANNAIRDVNK